MSHVAALAAAATPAREYIHSLLHSKSNPQNKDWIVILLAVYGQRRTRTVSCLVECVDPDLVVKPQERGGGEAREGQK